MGTKNKASRPGRGAQPKASILPQADSQDPVMPSQKAVQAASDGAGTAKQTSEKQPETIRKGIYLSALVYIEGEQAAPDDFVALTTSALKKNLGVYFAAQHDGLTMSLKKVEVQNNVEEGNGDESGTDAGGAGGVGKKKDEKFQF